MTNVDLINQQGVSLIISARNEERTLPMTVCSLLEDCFTSGITKVECIIVDNGSTDETGRFFSWKAVEKGIHTKYQYSPRGSVYTGKVKILFDPVMSNVGARTKGVAWAKYENILFSDAHMVVRPGAIKSIISALIQYKGIVHGTVSWMGADPADPNPGRQYSYKIGEKGPYGTWNPTKVADTPFYIPLCGHCFLAVKKDEFLAKGGYPLAQRVYGGGEPYLDTVYWMTGSHSMSDPNCLVYHLSAGRGYNYHSDDLLHNMFLVSYILGGKKWADRSLITYMNKLGNNPRLLQLYNEALEEGEEQRLWLEKNRKLSFEEVLRLDWVNDCDKCTKRGRKDPHPMRPWDIKNEELHGNHRSWVTEFVLSKREDGIIRIGETPITEPHAVELASTYL